MKCQADIQALAEERLKDAECLLANKRFDASFYFAGYVIELLLKAMVCKTFGIDNFFDEENSPAKMLQGGGTTFKVHKFKQLIILSGLYVRLDTELKNPDFKKQWSFVSEWSESSRYLTGKAKADAEKFLTSIRRIKEWIESQL